MKGLPLSTSSLGIRYCPPPDAWTRGERNSLGAAALSCRQSGVDPEAYTADVLDAVSIAPASRIAQLTPWAWAARQGAYDH